MVIAPGYNFVYPMMATAMKAMHLVLWQEQELKTLYGRMSRNGNSATVIVESSSSSSITIEDHCGLWLRKQISCGCGSKNDNHSCSKNNSCVDTNHVCHSNSNSCGNT